MNFIRRSKSFVIWIFTTLAILYLSFSDLIKQATLSSFETDWYFYKQNFQRSRFAPSQKILLMRLHYADRLDFWFDESTKKKTSEVLLKYPGPIVTNLDTYRFQTDSNLKRVLEMPQLIRAFRIDLGAPTNEDLEPIVAKMVDQDERDLRTVEDCQNSVLPDCVNFGSSFRINPEMTNYFADGHFWGFQEVHQSAASHYVSDLPLSLKGTRLRLPSPLLGALALYNKNKEFRLKRDEIVLPESPLKFVVSDPLKPLFYSKPFKTVTLENLKPEKDILIFEVVDKSSYFVTPSNSRSTWGEITATGLSNILENHLPVRSALLRWIEASIFIFACFLIIYGFTKFKFVSFLSLLFLLFATLVGCDFIATVLLNLRTEPMGELAALGLFSFAAVGIRAKREFEERNVMEQAFGGYISHERLKRILSGKETLKLEGRHAELTTMILDIEGFGKMTKQMSIDEVFKFIQKFFAAVDPIIFRHHGMIDKKMGDGFLAFFGDEENLTPQDAARQAMNASIEILKTLSIIPPNYFGLQNKFKVRIGINTGLMMIGNTGSRRHFNYTVLGDVVNMTQRIQAAAPSGMVLIGENTKNYLEQDKYEYEPLNVPLKQGEGEATAYLAKLNI